MIENFPFPCTIGMPTTKFLFLQFIDRQVAHQQLNSSKSLNAYKTLLVVANCFELFGAKPIELSNKTPTTSNSWNLKLDKFGKMKWLLTNHWNYLRWWNVWNKDAIEHLCIRHDAMDAFGCKCNSMSRQYRVILGQPRSKRDQAAQKIIKGNQKSCHSVVINLVATEITFRQRSMFLGSDNFFNCWINGHCWLDN